MEEDMNRAEQEYLNGSFPPAGFRFNSRGEIDNNVGSVFNLHRGYHHDCVAKYYNRIWHFNCTGLECYGHMDVSDVSLEVLHSSPCTCVSIDPEWQELTMKQCIDKKIYFETYNQAHNIGVLLVGKMRGFPPMLSSQNVPPPGAPLLKDFSALFGFHGNEKWSVTQFEVDPNKGYRISSMPYLLNLKSREDHSRAVNECVFCQVNIANVRLFCPNGCGAELCSPCLKQYQWTRTPGVQDTTPTDDIILEENPNREWVKCPYNCNKVEIKYVVNIQKGTVERIPQGPVGWCYNRPVWEITSAVKRANRRVLVPVHNRRRELTQSIQEWTNYMRLIEDAKNGVAPGVQAYGWKSSDQLEESLVECVTRLSGWKREMSKLVIPEWATNWDSRTPLPTFDVMN